MPRIILHSLKGVLEEYLYAMVAASSFGRTAAKLVQWIMFEIPRHRVVLRNQDYANSTEELPEINAGAEVAAESRCGVLFSKSGVSFVASRNSSSMQFRVGGIGSGSTRGGSDVFMEHEACIIGIEGVLVSCVAVQHSAALQLLVAVYRNQQDGPKPQRCSRQEINGFPEGRRWQFV